jgi:uncharacterized zinc-type alcohol dehydrogenase-like protein
VSYKPSYSQRYIDALQAGAKPELHQKSEMTMFSCTGYAAPSPKEPLAPFQFERRDPGPDDIEIKILYCGVCHSDLHQARDEWVNTVYPCVPGQ